VANPIEIPGFELAILGALDTEPEGEIARYSKYLRSPSSYDGFGKLPEELRRLIVSNLASGDIANLRLASRSFLDVTKAMFRRLLLEEMPWFWEIDVIAETYQKRCDYFKSGDPTYADNRYGINWF
jgi:hypothetical protein